MHNAVAIVGRFKREVKHTVYVCKTDARWHVYPSDDGYRFLETVVCGEVYRLHASRTFWFTPPCAGTRLAPADDAALAGLPTITI